MKNFFKRLIYYWRIPFYILVLSTIFFILALIFKGGVSTAFGVMFLFGCTFFVMSIFVVLYVRVADIINYFKYGIEKDYDLPEIDFIYYVFDSISDDISTFKDLSVKNKIRCIAFRLIGVLLVIGGCFGAFMFSFSMILIVVFTLVIIGGVTLWIVSSPNKFNSRVEGSRIIACESDLTDERLYEYLKNETTSLGVPSFAKVFGYENEVMVYGTNYDKYVYVVYKSKSSDFFIISAISVLLVESELPIMASDDPYHSTSTVSDFGYYLDELEEVVELAVKRAETLTD